jgi:cytochrome P450
LPSIAQTAPGPRGLAFLRQLLEVRHDRLGLVTRIAREFGDIAQFRMGLRVLYLVNQPDSIGHILQKNHGNYLKGVGLVQARRWLGKGLVTSEGEAWSRQRQLIQPSFQRQHQASFAAVVTAATGTMLERWSETAEQGGNLEIPSQMMRLTLEVITRAMFHTQITDSDAVGAAFTVALQDTMDRMAAVLIFPDWLPFPGKIRFKRALRTLDMIVNEIIYEHRREGINRNDLLSRLAAGSEEVPGGLGDQEIRDEVMTMLLAGHETTASSIAWTFYLLSLHPSAWRRLREEVIQVLGDRAPTLEDLPQLTWARMVFEESLRLYPPVWLIPRQSVAADELGGYQIPAGSDVLISPYVLHRHPGYWERPDNFEPERFSTPPRRYIYLPFGAGPRACVGSSLASIEAILVLAMVTQRYRLELLPGVDVVPEPLLTLRFRHGLPMKLALL